MDDLNKPAQDTPEGSPGSGISPYLTLDPKYIYITLKRRFVFWLIVAMTLSAVFFAVSKVMIKKTWKARCILIKHSKNLALGTDIPYLYQEVDFNTILETVRLRENLVEVIKKDNLKMTPEELFQHIEVNRGNRSNILTITGYGSTPQQAAAITNGISESFIENYNRIMNSSSDRVYKYYLTQREDMIQQIAVAETEFNAFRNKKGIVSYEDELGLKLQKLSQMELELEQTLMEEKETLTKIEDLKSRISKLPDQVKLTETYRQLEESLRRDLQRKLEELQQKYTDENPKVVEVKSQLEALDKNSATSNKKTVDEETYGENFIKRSLLINMTTLENELVAIREKIIGYHESIARYKLNLDDMTQKQKEYFDTKRKVDLKRELLKIVETRIQESKMARDANVGDLEIVEKAQTPKTPEPTRRKIMAGLVLLGVFGLGMGYTALRAVLDWTVKTPADVKSIKGLNHLGVLPDKNRVNETDYYSHLQRILYQLDEQAGDRKPVVVTFAGLNGREGKTTLIQEIMDIKTRVGKKVLIIERVFDTQDFPKGSVINDYLFLNVKDFPVPVKLSTTCFKLYLVAGSDFYREYLSGDRFQDFMNQLSDFDYILLELFNYPVNMQVYNCIVGASSINLMMMRYRNTSKIALNNTLNEIGQGKPVSVQGIINFIDPSYE